MFEHYPHLTPAQQANVDRGRAMLLLLEQGADQPVTLARHASRHCAVRLDANVPTDSGAQWQQIAVTGTYLGYRDGEQPFQFTPDTFSSVIANFHRSPQYRPDGTGLVVPYDVGHQSTQPGNPPASYAAVGWIGELETRPNPAGGLGLWGLTRWTPDMATAIRDGAFAFSSVVVEFSSIDPVTGQDVGPTLSSVAATNTPFLQNLQRLVASRTHEQGPNNMQPRFTITLPRGVAPTSQLITAALKLAAGKAEIGGVGASDVNNRSPNWTPLEELPQSRFNELRNAARKLQFNPATDAAKCRAWLESLGPEVAAELRLDIPGRAEVVVGSILIALAEESQSSGDAPGARNLDPVMPVIQFSRQPIDAREQVGRNPTERAIAALAAHSPRFAKLSFADAVHEATERLRDGEVIA